MSANRSDIVAARAVGCGIGLIALMVVWLIGNRLTLLVWDAPTGPTVAFVGAVAVGAATAGVAAHRLATRVRDDWRSASAP